MPDVVFNHYDMAMILHVKLCVCLCFSSNLCANQGNTRSNLFWAYCCYFLTMILMNTGSGS